MVATMQKQNIRTAIRNAYLADEETCVRALAASIKLDETERQAISLEATRLVRELRSTTSPTMMESFLGQYGLSTQEGIALMCLAEALLRVPDTDTIDELIADKITPSKWGEHLGRSTSSLVNASTWALLLTGKVLSSDNQGIAGALHGMVKRLGEPVVRKAVSQAMKELGRQFVLGRSIEEARKNARTYEDKGFTYSYDMLGEAALTEEDAKRYHKAYADAIGEIAKACTSSEIRENPGISVKLSALHPRYEFAKKTRVLQELVPRTLSLAKLARDAGMGFNIDAEEADRLDLSLDVIEQVLSDPALEGWDGFGVVVQAFGQRCGLVIDWLYELATKHDRKIMVRLVKGAYWDSEIKRAQTMGLEGFPVFTRKNNTDISYAACAQKLLAMTDRIYPQFATHNAHSVATILEMAKALPKSSFEFQRLHGMGEALHDITMQAHDTRCRIYAPVGAHKDLLAYLVRRLLENGANSSFVNQIRNEAISPETIAEDPIEHFETTSLPIYNDRIATAPRLFGPHRKNSRGWDLSDPLAMDEYLTELNGFKHKRWTCEPLIAAPVEGTSPKDILNPADLTDVVGTVRNASANDISKALTAAEAGAQEWAALPVAKRAELLNKTADLYEEHAYEIFAVLTREAGKSYMDAINELREAVDFARYYAQEALRLEEERGKIAARGIISCISPWNFPLAIFSGQVFAALAAGNAVLAKPAAPTPLIAAVGVRLMHEAGIPKASVQLLPGGGSDVGAALTKDPRISGVSFTGSTATAQTINKAMAQNLSPAAPLIAETGGLNAMIVDSTALPEQAIRDIITSSFQSAGQRCSALRMLYVQEDVADRFLTMLFGAMDELELGNPWSLSVDVGPVIDVPSQDKIEAHCAKWAEKGRVLKTLKKPEGGYFVSPTVIKLTGIEELEEEIFGPVLHVATFKADQVDKVINDINGKGFGLTFGLHTRIDSRVQHIVDRVKTGNIYVNRNQIGAIVGSQPFGGEGLSGTGPKAGGPHYVARLVEPKLAAIRLREELPIVGSASLQQMLNEIGQRTWTDPDRFNKLAAAFPVHRELIDEAEMTQVFIMPGPTGETNKLSSAPRGTILCLGPNREALEEQAICALASGNAVVLVGELASELSAELTRLGAPSAALDGHLSAASLSKVEHVHAVASFAELAELKEMRNALAERDGALLPLICERGQPERYALERHLCVDTTAAGGNASLLAAAES
ncbi:bifunctional proline dehydrogenase/L-glutamate gamma-semialdehyde dehydrogenase PutA [Pseudovibrio exalbescens]|uniref:bifunctional proline dehydrogenase/L-glutamate gamma-semialdehyde dehydrogenase PutA n=1 Tax=Pseudovibrio exalbescens TaxID=197461 RepID=UPI002366771A|nr:bifunctional proline dehydrogenase/L-glutamate gamma-semialdehyde dehydrogenase PutA [Pseudovibrio exalbescens]MDD7910759.1 bifunctional proline dehydrogenase/L-glutamate gamma-semialdehyde dehydrogenase PutA [Pseudovibrio exalbescens]